MNGFKKHSKSCNISGYKSNDSKWSVGGKVDWLEIES